MGIIISYFVGHRKILADVVLNAQLIIADAIILFDVFAIKYVLFTRLQVVPMSPSYNPSFPDGHPGLTSALGGLSVKMTN